MARLSFRCGDELVAAVDAARGDVARERWLRKAVERALEQPLSNVDLPVRPTVESPAPAEQLEQKLRREVERFEPDLRELGESRAEMFRRATQR